MIIITGGAGLIGSCVVWLLNQRGEKDIMIVDSIIDFAHERNLTPLHYKKLVSDNEFRQKLRRGNYNTSEVKGIIHLGAINSTTETRWEKLEDTNVRFSKEIIDWCAHRKNKCVYASSASVYGAGEHGYNDGHELFDNLKPLNLYARSKLTVDIWARDNGFLDNVVGVRFFNVFGPNEQHKKHMRSVIAKQYDDIKQTGVLKLFRSYRPEYKDGEQKRDFLYVKDAAKATLFLYDQSDKAGVFNVGTGTARSWNELAYAMFNAMNKEPMIEYIDMPENIRKHYQYYTQADISKLRAAGYAEKFTSLEESVADYIQNYIEKDRHLGEEDY